eukprot:1187862-Prorocentrum_minimum.AAC.3
MVCLPGGSRGTIFAMSRSKPMSSMRSASSSTSVCVCSRLTTAFPLWALGIKEKKQIRLPAWQHTNAKAACPYCHILHCCHPPANVTSSSATVSPLRMPYPALRVPYGCPYCQPPPIVTLSAVTGGVTNRACHLYHRLRFPAWQRAHARECTGGERKSIMRPGVATTTSAPRRNCTACSSADQIAIYEAA